MLFMISKPQTYFIKTYGCQANVADSERIAYRLGEAGLVSVDDIKRADWVIINSCAVRQSAEDRVYGLVNNIQKLKIKNRKLKIKVVLTGCLLYRPIIYLKRRLPAVDYFVLKSDWPKFIQETVANKAAEKVGNEGEERVTVLMDDGNRYALLPIMEGCNNFCTYCVVPYARGREVYQPMGRLLSKTKELVNRGYTNVLLLGQNVNSYKGKLVMSDPRLLELNGKYKSRFALLLAMLNEIKGLEKIAFLSSNPWDLTDDIIEAMALPKISRYFHLPVQSGDEEILRRMNRKYTPLQYIELVRKIREKIPDIKLSTDVIVGFPGETREQFQHTVDLCQKVGFYKAYINKYSPRPGTPAFKMRDNVPLAEKKRRWKILDNLINHRRPRV